MDIHGIQWLNSLPVQQGWLTAAIMAAEALGKLAGKIKSGRAAARVQEAALNAEQDRLAQEKNRQDAENARANVSTDTAYRNTQMNNAVRGGLLSGMQDISFDVPELGPLPTITGGLRPSAIKGKQAMGDQFQRDAMLRYMQGAQGLHGDSPALTPVPQAGKLDKILGVASFIGGLAGLGKDTYRQIKGMDDGDMDTTMPGSAPNSQLLRGGIGNGALDQSQIPSAVTGSANTLKRLNTRQVRFGGR